MKGYIVYITILLCSPSVCYIAPSSGSNTETPHLPQLLRFFFFKKSPQKPLLIFKNTFVYKSL